MKKILSKFVFSFALAVMLSVLPSCAEIKPEYGTVRLRVVDGMTDSPIEGAIVKVAETGESFVTDESGMTGSMELPVIGDSEYDRLLPNDEGRLTFLVLAEGMTPYLLLYARVTPGCRRTVDILMFPDDGSLPVFTVIEAPSAGWSKALKEKLTGQPD
ncbi:MAG: hypothetical protein J5854_05400 [Clostridia bacterium]|nr:hypothetical protein [Clostridia bacterium]